MKTKKTGKLSFDKLVIAKVSNMKMIRGAGPTTGCYTNSFVICESDLTVKPGQNKDSNTCDSRDCDIEIA